MRIKHLDPDLVNRCQNGDHDAIKEAVGSLNTKGLSDLLVTPTDHRWWQGYLHALATVGSLVNKS